MGTGSGLSWFVDVFLCSSVPEDPWPRHGWDARDTVRYSRQPRVCQIKAAKRAEAASAAVVEENRRLEGEIAAARVACEQRMPTHPSVCRTSSR